MMDSSEMSFKVVIHCPSNAADDLSCWCYWVVPR